jgi:hypothetical protein
MYDAKKEAEAYPPTITVTRISEMPKLSLARIGTKVKAESIAAPDII